MITNAGKDTIKKYFGKQVGGIGGAIALGVGTTAETVGDTKLAFEAVRASTGSVRSDLTNSRIIFKATFAPGIVAEIREVGLYQDAASTSRLKHLSIGQGSRAQWTNGLFGTQFGRVNTQTVKIDAPAGTSTTASINNMSQDISSYVTSDTVALAFYSTNLTSVKLRLGSDANNYQQFTFTPQAGYNTVRATLGSATVVGAPDLSAMDYIAAIPTAGAGSTGSLYLDGLAVEDNSITDNVLVMRKVLATPLVPDAFISTDVELSLVINV